MSFSTGGLFQKESVEIAEVYLQSRDWKKAREHAVSVNLFQSRTLSSSKRRVREVVSRVNTLSISELELLVSGDDQEQKNILWIALCRYHRFIADFATEVLQERYITLKLDLGYEEFDHFFNRKAQWHGELDRIKESTRLKLRQILFKMLREAGLLTPNNMIIPVMPSSRLVGLIKVDNRLRDILYFPVFEADI